MPKLPTPPKNVEALKHDDATRKNIPTAEYESVLQKTEKTPVRVAYERRNRDLDPQLVWRGKDDQDWSDLVVHAPPLYIQEKVHPKVLIEDLLRETRERNHDSGQTTLDLFADFNGIPEGADKTDFYQHDQNWSNRMILGDSLQVMASLAEREKLRGQVQCIYFDPPYGIKFNSNFQWSTTDKAGTESDSAQKISREPEQVKAFRDTWRDGIHSYLTYLRDRLTAARDLLTDTGSIFVQIGDENVHRVRALMDEVFASGNSILLINFQKTGGIEGQYLQNTVDYVLWYSKDSKVAKYRKLYQARKAGHASLDRYDQYQVNEVQTRALTSDEKKDDSSLDASRRCQLFPLYSDGESAGATREFEYRLRVYAIRAGTHWKTTQKGMALLAKAGRIESTGRTIRYKRFVGDVPLLPLTDRWESTQIGTERTYVVQTSTEVVKRCVLMATDPGDLVLDPTCGSGTTATVAEQWGRRWITIDTSRVALALARARIMGARYPFYLKADSREGQLKEAEVARTPPSSQPTQGNIAHGFVYERVPHITLKSIANNAEIDTIYENWQAKLEPLRESLNTALNKTWQEWEIPRDPDPKWPDATTKLHTAWWQARIARQQEIDKSIAAKAEFEFLYDKPYEDKKTVRVAGPFTVESLSPHRMLGMDENDELIDPLSKAADYGAKQSFPQMVLENLITSGVQQANKQDRIAFTSVIPWPGDLVCAEGVYLEGETKKRAAIFIGPEFGTVMRPDLVAAAREAGDADFDVLIACAFNYEAHATDFTKLGRIPVLKARMNADLHMAGDLKNTGKGNLFVIFGEPDITLIHEPDAKLRIKVNGVDVFDPSTGEVRSDSADGIACWFIDTDYNEESFFVRHAYFLGANDPYTALKTTLKSEINQEAWDTLKSDTSRAFPKPKSGRIAVKVINHLGDEVMKVFRVS
jgi:adenine-specific DNA-methyltransferase